MEAGRGTLMSDDVFESKENNYIKQLPDEGNIPFEGSSDPRKNNQIVKIIMVFPQVGIVTYG